MSTCRYTFSGDTMPVTALDPELQKINPVCLDILYRRGYRTSEEVRNLLFPSLARALQPFVCRDIQPTLSILERAVREKLPIAVYRDYDVDGITAGATAVETLAGLGANVRHYANDRHTDGFGICKNGIDNILARWPDTKIILTVDNGISNAEAVRYANSRGLTVVITDHHEPGAELPDAAAVIDLKRKDETYPYRELCGCGVIFRVMLDLYRRMGKDPAPVLDTLDMVALGTVADVVPLLGENRALVQEGTKRIASRQRPFFRSILNLCDAGEVTAHYTLAFQVAPVLNSLSRLGKDTAPAVDALISRDEAWVYEQCASFVETNTVRRERTQLEVEKAKILLRGHENDPAIVLYSKEFDDGLVGIIAGRLKEQYGRPVIVLAPGKEGYIKGSGRSISEIDLKAKLDPCRELLGVYGGHAKAVGLSLPAENLDAFRRMFTALVSEEMSRKEIKNTVALSAVLTEDTLTEDLLYDLKILEPYGEGFPEPLFGLKAAPDSVRYAGSEKQHAKMVCPSSGLAIIGWHMGDKIRQRKTLPQKFVGKPRLNIWNGRTSIQFILAQS